MKTALLNKSENLPAHFGFAALGQGNLPTKSFLSAGILLIRAGIEVNPGPPSRPATASPPCQSEEILEENEDLPIGARARGAPGDEEGANVSPGGFEGVFSAVRTEAPQARKRKRGPGRRGQPGPPAKRKKRPRTGTDNVSVNGRTGGRRAGTSVIDGISAMPAPEDGRGPGASQSEVLEEHSCDQASQEGVQAPGEHEGGQESGERQGGRRSGDREGSQGSGGSERGQEPGERERSQGSEEHDGGQGPGVRAEAPSGTGVPGHMSLEDQQAQANWTAAIMKVDELKPKSYKDYVRALRTYKVGSTRPCFRF